MDRKRFAQAAAAVMIATSLGCGANGNAPLSPTTSAAPDGISLKVTAPTPQSPVSGQRVSTLTPTLTAAPATADAGALPLQYRFQVFGDASSMVQDSGLVNAPTWTMATSLTPNKQFTWKLRAEYQGAAGPWSTTASFASPDPPPAYEVLGDWQSCGLRTKKLDLVMCVWAVVKPGNSVGDMEVVKRVAWLLRGEGAGLLIKNGGENAVLWQGYSFSASRICYSDGNIYKVIIDAGPGGGNLPTFADNDFVDPKLYVPAIDPSKP